MVFAGHSVAAGALVVTAAAVGNLVLIAIAAAAAVGGVGATVETLISQEDDESARTAEEILRRDSLAVRVIKFSPDYVRLRPAAPGEASGNSWCSEVPTAAVDKGRIACGGLPE